MKILQIIPHLGSGGAERFVVDLSNELCLLGQQVVLCTLYKLDGALGFYKNDIDPSVKVISLDKHPGFSLKSIFQLIKIINQESPDVIHSHVNVLQYSAISQIFQAKGFHTVHNEAHREAAGLLEILLRKFVFKTGLITPVSISNESHDSFVSFYHRDVYLINNGRSIGNVSVSQNVKDEIQHFVMNENTKVIVHLARFQEQKNIPMMARVANRLFSEGYNFTLLFIGNTDNEKILEEVKREMPSCAHVLGERHNPLEYLMEAGCFALSSLYEGMPISLIEALGVGALPVCTPVGGIPNAIVNGENGILSSDTSEDAYYLALKSYLDLPIEIINQMRVKAKESFKPYSMSVCAKRYLDLFLKYSLK